MCDIKPKMESIFQKTVCLYEGTFWVSQNAMDKTFCCLCVLPHSWILLAALKTCLSNLIFMIRGSILKWKACHSLELSGSSAGCFIHPAALGSDCWQSSAGAARTAALCAGWVTHRKLQLQAGFLHPAVTTCFVPDYLLSFWVGRISEVQLVIMPFVPRVIIFLKAFILFSASHTTPKKPCRNTGM